MKKANGNKKVIKNEKKNTCVKLIIYYIKSMEAK